MRLNGDGWKPRDRIQRGRDALGVVEVRATSEKVTLVVRGHVRESD
jgi:hypothetical protein